MDNEFVSNTHYPVKGLLILIQQDDIEKIRESLFDSIDRTHLGGEVYLYEQADKPLYYSKVHERNKTSSYEKLLVENKIKATIIDENDIEIF